MSKWLQFSMNKIYKINIISITSLVFVLVLTFASCGSIKTIRRITPVKIAYVITKPVISDLQVDDSKKSGSATESSTVPLETLKNAAIMDVLLKNNGDILIAPVYVIKRDPIQTSITVYGYVANYVNLRQDTLISYNKITSIKHVKSNKKNDECLKDSKKILIPNVRKNDTVQLADNFTIGVNSLNEEVILPNFKNKAADNKNNLKDNVINDSNLSKENTDNNIAETKLPEVEEVEEFAADTIEILEDKKIAISEKTNYSKTSNEAILNEVTKKEPKSVIDSEISAKNSEDNSKKIEQEVTEVKSATKINNKSTENVTKSTQALEKGTVLMLDKNKYIGDVKAGVPHGIGTIYYTTKTKLSVINNLDVYARKGDYLTGRWYNGELEYGVLYDSEGEIVSKITIGR